MIPDLIARRLGEFRFVAFDVETANGQARSICQMGFACVDFAGRIETFSLLVDPGEEFSAFNTQLHGIDAARVWGQPGFAEVMAWVAPLMAGQVVVQHSTFDQRAVGAACDWAGLEVPGFSWANSVSVARRAWPEFIGNGGHGLGHLKRALGLRFDHHDAGEDARAAAEVVLLAEARLGLPFGEILAPKVAKRSKG